MPPSATWGVRSNAGPSGGAPRPTRSGRPAWSSVAVRLAPHTGQPRRLTPGPVAEAAVAWWHAYEAKRRYLYVAALVAVFAFFAMVIRYDAAAALVAAAVPTVRRGF